MAILEKSEDPLVQEDCLTVLRFKGSADVTPRLIALYDEVDDDVRYRILLTLCSILASDIYADDILFWGEPIVHRIATATPKSDVRRWKHAFRSLLIRVLEDDVVVDLDRRRELNRIRGIVEGKWWRRILPRVFSRWMNRE